MADARREEALDHEANERRAAEAREPREGRVPRGHVARAEAPAEPDPRERRAADAHAGARSRRSRSLRAAEAIRGAVREPGADHRRPARPVARAHRQDGADARAHCRSIRSCARIAEVAKKDADARGVALRFEIEPEVDFSIMCDPVRIEQIVWNLVSNAIKFTRADDRIDIRLQRQDGHARLEVVGHRRRRREVVPAERVLDVPAGAARRCGGRHGHRTRARQGARRGAGRLGRGALRRRRQGRDVRRDAAARVERRGTRGGRRRDGRERAARPEGARRRRHVRGADAVRRAAPARRRDRDRGGRADARRWSASPPSRSIC